MGWRVAGLAMAALAVCGGCVSETFRPDGGIMEEKQPSTGPSPVERVEARVRSKIEQMKIEQGGELVRTMQEIAAYRELALSPIAETLPNTDATQRANLVYVLGLIGGSEAHAIVGAQLRDKDPVVRYEAASSLLQFRDWSGVPVLIGFLGDQDRRMRYKAFQALKEFTKEDLGYDFAGSDEERAAAVGRWSKWWQRRRAELVYK